MTCNFGNHAKELNEAFESVSNSTTGDEWVIFDYEGNSNIVKVGQSGTGGIDELTSNFNSGKIQYGFASVKSPGSTQRKVVLIHWQGDGVPAMRKANTSSHVDEVRRFVKRVHLTIHARSEEDVDHDAITKQVAGLAGGVTERPSPASVAAYEPPEPVKSVYMPQKPHKDIDLQEREKFWREMQAEEDARRREEVKKNEDRNRQLAEERKQVEKELHETYISSATAKSPTAPANQLDYKSYAQQPKKGNLITGRTQMFEQKVAELVATAPKPLAKPKNFKYEIKTTKPTGVPVNRDEIQNQNHTKAYENNTINKDKPVFAKIASQPVYEGAEDDTPHRKYPPFSGVKLPSPQSPPPPPQVVSPVKAQHETIQKKPSNELPVFHKSNTEFDEPTPPVVPLFAPPPPLPTSTPPEVQTNNTSLPNYDFPPVVNEVNEAPKFTPSQYDFPPEQNESAPEPQNGLNGHKGDGENLRAVALWDYQADDDTEITFNPNDIITDIEMLHDGWWQGRGPDGSFGLFPSNYVKII
uniref:Drebrin-like protein n=1 Tax=Acrobeloides nanus TaxID=290746 RepID=A0A914D894_9BILA